MVKLPDNAPPIPAELKPLFEALVGALEDARKKIGELEAALKGERQKRSSYDPRQMYLPFAQTPERAPAPPECDDGSGTDHERNGHGRGELPAHLPRQREELHPPKEELRCKGCQDELKKIGEELTHEIEHQPATYWVKEIVRIKYACKKCQENVVIAALPPRPILKGRPAASMLANVVGGKYEDHQPLNRQAQQFRRSGLKIAVSTLCDWVGRVEEMYKPVYAAMKQEAFAGGLLNSDDTPVPVLAGPGQTKPGRLWVHIGGGAVVFDYAPDKSAQWLHSFLKGYRGLFQGDSSSVNVSFAREGQIIHGGCWAHAQRRFTDALEESPQLAQEGRMFIRALYAVEREARERERMNPVFGAKERAALRKEKAGPALEKFRTWLEVHERTTLPESKLGKAIAYVLSQWKALTRYVEHGEFAIDNNIAERNLRAVAVGRHNWIFAGSDEGGRRAAAMYSIVQSCKMHGLSSYAYLRETIPLLGLHPARELTPKAWAERKRNELRNNIPIAAGKGKDF